ncbi:MAG: DNA polymerase IV [Clostridiales bacterium]|nr:DNA polymerase IV [Clostridiales bacterium]
MGFTYNPLIYSHKSPLDLREHSFYNKNKCSTEVRSVDNRVILHCDLNNFFASVECLFRKDLAGLPVAVCGSVENRHGIVLAKNEIAKGFGVKTAQAIWQAQLKCPKLVIIPPHYDKYLEFSRRAREIYERYTDMIEPFGIDECWLDVTGSQTLFGSGEKMANEIRTAVKKELGVTISAGVSFNKVFAKLGSDMKKPDAVTVLSKENFKEKAWPLKANEILGVGRSTEKSLRGLGIFTIGDLARTPENVLSAALGKHGRVLWKYANGLDNSRVIRDCEQPPAKTIGRSMTCKRDLENNADVKRVFFALAESVTHSLRENKAMAGTVQITIRDSLLNIQEHQQRLTMPTRLTTILTYTGMEIFTRHWDWRRPVRSVGIRACELVSEGENYQLTFDHDYEKLEQLERLEKSIDTIRGRYGDDALVRAILI